MAATVRQDGDVARWKGVFPAIPTPFHTDGRVNEGALRAVLEDNISHGVHGFWIAGGTGEGAIMNDEQRIAVARVAGEVCRGRALSIMHVGAATTASAVKAAQAARESGCDAICCVPPFFYRPSEESTIEHYRRVADAADLPFFAYNLPQLTNVEITVPLMEQLMRAVPQLTGLKHSSPNFSALADFAAMGLRAFVGNGLLLLPALAYGGIGVVDAPPGVAPWLYVDLFRAWEAGDIEKATSLQEKTRDVVGAVRMFGAAQHVVKVIFSQRLGIDCGEPLPPVNRLSEEQTQAVLSRAAELNLLAPPVPV